MKRLLGGALALALASPVTAQSADQEALGLVKALFDAMRLQDTTAMRGTMHPAMRLVGTGTNREGVPVARAFPIEGWLRSIAGAPGKPDERLFDPEVRVDGNLATVWTRYDFYVGETFSHCGYDSFFLAKTGGKWQIVQGADTQRRSPEQCGRGAAPAAVSPPSATDTAAVVAAVQKTFDGMLARDTAALRSVFMADARLQALSPDGTTLRTSAAAEWIGQIASAQDELRERMYDPEVRISDNLATIWTYYDFHRGAQFSHCGVDAVQLVRTADGWKIAHIAYTVRRTQCERPNKKLP
ncbi:MAG TPA: nuclear transport factor 2 family protein [Longimicrobiales bacterium]|nr:nuclear transport factor 2 family protein [Longimicrobiales bacterium]